MKHIALALCVYFAVVVFNTSDLANAGESLIQSETYEHGGGCRKSSPPGQCCHMETRTGNVHCH